MYICGQKNIVGRVNALVESNKFPRFCILVGNVGFGKKVVSEYISHKLGASFVPCGIKAEDVRDIIYNSYFCTNKTLYMFADCDYMSISSKNALLKVTEEPPNDAYFVMTVNDISSVLGTIVSRGTVFYLDPYSEKDITEFIEKKEYRFGSKEYSIIKRISMCPNDVIIASNIDIIKTYDVADKFIEFIGDANLSNELKISSMINTKKDQTDLIDPVIFLRCILICCNDILLNTVETKNVVKIHKIIKETSNALYKLQLKSSNKQIILDNWILSTHMSITGGGI